ncbi:MAG TPA: hypothetical protein DCR93_16315 [Cytophagales bacterium]|nr:hypothetical protein [Cytophagales bacterium]HAP60991.1 hypothetical protein [Cytophagales bacterium]
MNAIEAYILHLINDAPTAEALIARIKDDPRDGAGYGLGPKTAEAVLALRDEKGGFQSLQDLLEVSGFGVNKLNDFIHSFEGEPTSDAASQEDTGPVKSPPRPTDDDSNDGPPVDPNTTGRDILLKCLAPGQSMAGYRLHLRPLPGTPAPMLDTYPIAETGYVRLHLASSPTTMHFKAYLINASGVLKYSYPIAIPAG